MQPIGRHSYFFCGLLLMLVKFAIDASILKSFGRPWTWMLYWSPLNLSVFNYPASELNLALSLLAVSIPFTALGIWLTARRLLALRLGLWLSILFFLPVVKVIFFTYLVAAPEFFDEKENIGSSPPRSRFFNRRRPASMFAAAGIAAVCACLAVGLSVAPMQTYGLGIFFAVPFGTGVLTTLLVSIPAPRSFGYCFGSALLALGMAALGLLAVAFEGMICLLMCVPLAIPLAALGVVVGREILRPDPRHATRQAMIVAASLLTLCPLSAAGERIANAPLELFSVVTTIEIDAPPARVWPLVIAFPELPPPTELIFRVGIAHPIRARIVGTGPGAIRYCEFSTRPFVEPITDWQEQKLLAFSVSGSPAPLTELSPYAIHPPHLDGYLQSKRGQFKLTPLHSGRRTLLEGTTWYRQSLYPSAYWCLWTDAIIHKVHLRVLEHIRTLSES